MTIRLPALNVRREAILIALAAAETCWFSPFFLALNRTTVRHPPLLLALAVAVLLLGFCYFYRALAEANLPARARQAVSVLALLLSVVLFFRYHLYAGADPGQSWLGHALARLVTMTEFVPGEMLTILALIFLWGRGIHLARRSLSVDSVAFSFRAGVVIWIAFCLAIATTTDQDPTPFIVPFFFFALLAIALARLEEVSHLPGGGRAPFAGFWVGSSVLAVGLLVLAATGVAVLFYGGALETVIRWLSPVLFAVQVVLVGLLVVVFAAVQWVVSSLPLNFKGISEFLESLMLRLQTIAAGLQPEPDGTTTPPAIIPWLHAGTTVGIIVGLIAVVVVWSWYRSRRARAASSADERESLLSAQALAQGLRDLLAAGRQRLDDLAGRLGRLGPAFLSAVSIRHIYANLVRLAAQAGYPRAEAQTPFEYLPVLCRALPDSAAEADLITRAYVNAHYGQLPDTPEELQHIRAAWQRVRERYGRQDRRGPA